MYYATNYCNHLKYVLNRDIKLSLFVLLLITCKPYLTELLRVFWQNGLDDFAINSI